MATRIPTDSADAAELREQREAFEAERDRRLREHAATCRAGWLGEDSGGRPVACPVCRPWTHDVPCRTCARSQRICDSQRDRRLGACCDACAHQRAER